MIIAKPTKSIQSKYLKSRHKLIYTTKRTKKLDFLYSILLYFYFVKNPKFEKSQSRDPKFLSRKLKFDLLNTNF